MMLRMFFVSSVYCQAIVTVFWVTKCNQFILNYNNIITELSSKYANKLLNNMLDVAKILFTFVATQKLDKTLIKSCLNAKFC